MIDRLEEEMELTNVEKSAYESICQVMVSNLATFDLEKFKMGREKGYYQLVSQLGKQTIEELKESTNYYEHIIKILNNN